jgi:hypothetical protein
MTDTAGRAHCLAVRCHMNSHHTIPLEVLEVFLKSLLRRYCLRGLRQFVESAKALNNSPSLRYLCGRVHRPKKPSRLTQRSYNRATLG